MSIKSAHGVFPDKLAVSFSAENSPDLELRKYLEGLGFYRTRSPKDDYGCPGGGLVTFWCRSRYHNVQISGSALRYIISTADIDRLVAIIASAPHKITQLDLARDSDLDSVAQVAEVLQDVFDRGVRLYDV